LHLRATSAPPAAAAFCAIVEAGQPVDSRIVNTSSGAGLMGSVGQGNYSAAKAAFSA